MERVQVLQQWLEMARDDETLIDLDDINHEANCNLWHFSPTEAQQPGITVAGLRDLIHALLEARRAQLGGHTMLFYCWHDAQVRQLRFSLISQAHGRLPFRREVQRLDSPDDIAARVHADWFELPLAQIPPPLLPVFVATIA